MALVYFVCKSMIQSNFIEQKFICWKPTRKKEPFNPFEVNEIYVIGVDGFYLNTY